MEDTYKILNERVITSIYTRYKTIKEHGKVKTNLTSVVLVINHEPVGDVIGLITDRRKFVQDVDLMRINPLRVRKLVEENMNRDPNYYIFGSYKW